MRRVGFAPKDKQNGEKINFAISNLGDYALERKNENFSINFFSNSSRDRIDLLAVVCRNLSPGKESLETPVQFIM
jgi:hypothetical protein